WEATLGELTDWWTRRRAALAAVATGGEAAPADLALVRATPAERLAALRPRDGALRGDARPRTARVVVGEREVSVVAAMAEPACGPTVPAHDLSQVQDAPCAVAQQVRWHRACTLRMMPLTRPAMKASPRAVSGAQMDLVEFGAIPVLKYLWPDSETLNAELRRVIMAKMASSPGVVDSNEGGWHSTRDLPTWEDAAIARLIDRVQSMVRELVALTVPDPTPGHLDGWEIEGWANVNTRGALNKSHHPAGGRTNRNLWSGIYYVDDGGRPTDAAHAGVTKFE